jgi:N-acetylmuramate 1-kinase
MPTPSIAGFVLAAGEGPRLRPATLVRPKALMPFCGVPVLELAVSQIVRLGVREVVVNAWHLATLVEDAVADLQREQGLEWDLRLSREPRLLGTGGGLKRGAALVPDAERFLVHNTDVILDFPLERLLEAHAVRKAAVTALLVPGRGPCTINGDADGRITDFRRARGEGQYTFAGVYVIERRILDRVPEQRPSSIIDAMEAAAAAGEFVAGLSVGDAYWTDLGEPGDYIRAHGDVADIGLLHHPRLRDAQAEQARRRADFERVQGIRCTGAVGLGKGLVVPAGAHLHNVVLWDDTRIARPHIYADSILAGDAVFPPPVTDTRRPDPRVFAAMDLDPATCRIQNLRKQGSGRRYARIHAADGQSWVWCVYSPERRENAAFVAVAEFLGRLGLRVPRTLLHLGDVCEIVSEDLGRESLQDVTDPALIERCLLEVVAQVARLHVLGDRAVRLEELPLQLGFTKGLYDWERDYFREHILGNLLKAPGMWASVAQEYCDLRGRLLAEPTVPIHRDLQAANIMLHGGQPYLIDFQGMRLGCGAYDLGSLLYDPYMTHAPELRAHVWAHYREEVARLGGTPPDETLLGVAAAQRLLQALGAYGKLWLTDNLDWYRQFIMPALRSLESAARSAGFDRIAAMAVDVRAEARARVGD